LSVSKDFVFGLCIVVIYQKSQKEVSNSFAFGVCILGNLANERANLAYMPSRARLEKKPISPNGGWQFAREDDRERA